MFALEEALLSGSVDAGEACVGSSGVRMCPRLVQGDVGSRGGCFCSAGDSHVALLSRLR